MKCHLVRRLHEIGGYIMKTAAVFDEESKNIEALRTAQVLTALASAGLFGVAVSRQGQPPSAT